MDDEREDKTLYKVVISQDDRYSIWPANKENAFGWKDAGKTGFKQECLDYIKEVSSGTGPLNLRK